MSMQPYDTAQPKRMAQAAQSPNATASNTADFIRTMNTPVQGAPAQSVPTAWQQLQSALGGKVLYGALAASYLLGYCYMQAFLFSSNPQTEASCKLVFTLFFFAMGEVLFRVRAHAWQLAGKTEDTQNEKIPLAQGGKEHLFFMGCGIALALSIFCHRYFWHHGQSFAWMQWNHSDGLILLYGNFLLHAVAAYWVLCRFGWLHRGKTGSWLPFDLCNALVLFPFSKFFMRCEGLFRGVRHAVNACLRKKIEKKSVAVTLVALGVFGCFFAVALSLLKASDESFAALLQMFTFSFDLPYPVADFIIDFCFALPVGAYLFGLFAHCLGRKNAPTLLEEELNGICKGAEKCRVLSQGLLSAVLVCFLALYALYFGVQIEYFSSAFWGVLPERFTFSEYARQGFFELCKIMLLNFAVLGLVAKASVTPLRGTKLLKGTAYALLISSLLFAATALAKLCMYIHVYGFTDLRLLSCWAIFVLVLAVCLAASTIAKPKPVAATWIYAATASFTLLCFLGV